MQERDDSGFTMVVAVEVGEVVRSCIYFASETNKMC